MAKLIPLWDIVQEVFAEKGVKLTPRFTLLICDKIAKEINEELNAKAQALKNSPKT